MDNVLEGVASFAAANVAALVSTASLTKGLHHLSNESHRVLVSVDALSLLLILGLILVSDDNHSIRGTSRSPNLEHSVFISLALFTRSTQVEVLLDRGLIADATDGLLVRAAIAVDALMDNLSLFSSHINISEVIRLNKLIENFFGLLLELLVDEVLNGLSRNAELLNLGLLGTLELFGKRGGWVGLGVPDSKDELHIVSICQCEGHLHVIVIFNDYPVIAIVILELDFSWADLVLRSELVSGGDKRLVVGSQYFLEDGAFALV